MVALFSTSQNYEHEEFFKQIQWIIISIPFFILAFVIDYDKILKIAPVFYGACVNCNYCYSCYDILLANS